MSHRQRFLRRQIAVYRRALNQIENLALRQRYESLLDEALRELKVREDPAFPNALPESPMEQLRELIKSSATPSISSGAKTLGRVR